MMILENVKLNTQYNCHVELMNLIDFKNSVELTDSDKKIFCDATLLLAEHKEFADLKKRVVIFIFADKSFTLTFNENQYGSQGNYAAINYPKWVQLDTKTKLICITEELVHHFWNISDEIETSRIVCEIVPNLSYDKSTGNYIF